MINVITFEMVDTIQDTQARRDISKRLEKLYKYRKSVNSWRKEHKYNLLMGFLVEAYKYAKKGDLRWAFEVNHFDIFYKKRA